MKKYPVLFISFLVGVSSFVFAQQGGFTGDVQQGFTGEAQQSFGANQAQGQFPAGGPGHEGPRGAGPRHRQGVHQGYMRQTAMPVMINDPTTIINAVTLPHDSWVVLTGNIVNMLPGGKNYTFRDSSGEIVVDIGPKEWRGLSVGVSDDVTIYGEVKNNRGFTSIKVHAITGSGRINTWPNQAVFITRPATIGEAVTSPHDSFVILRGNIINAQARRNNYTFRDSTGEVTVDIGPKEWRGLSIGASDQIEIYGEVKNHRGFTSIKVHAIRLL